MLWRMDAGAAGGQFTLVAGPEAFLAERAVARLIDSVRAGAPDTDVTEVAGGDVTLGVLGESLSPSLFAASRALVVRDVQNVPDAVADALLAQAADPLPDASVVLIHPGGVKGKRFLDALRKAGVRVVPAEPLTRPDDLVDFIRSEAHAAGGQIDVPAARQLVEAVGADLRGLAASVAQLASDAPSHHVTAEIVAQYFEGHSEVKGWIVADRAVEGRTAEAVEQLRWALQAGTDPVLIIGAMATSLRSLARLSDSPSRASNSDLARSIGVPPWKVRVLRGQLRGWTPGGLAQAIGAVAAADLEVKGESTDATLALTKAVVAIGAAR